MSAEMAAAKTTQETIQKGVQVTEASLRKAWSLLDAAAQKETPARALSPKAIAAIQGKVGG